MLGSRFFSDPGRAAGPCNGRPVRLCAPGYVEPVPCRLCLSAGQIISGPHSDLEFGKSRINLDSNLTSSTHQLPTATRQIQQPRSEPSRNRRRVHRHNGLNSPSPEANWAQT